MFISIYVIHIILLIYHTVLGGSILTFPLQISADVDITAHLIAEASDYPPRNRKMKIYYDYVNKIARADIEEGYEASKSYIRRYDRKQEYMIRYPPIDDCKRSYLGICLVII